MHLTAQPYPYAGSKMKATLTIGHRLPRRASSQSVDRHHACRQAWGPFLATSGTLLPHVPRECHTLPSISLYLVIHLLLCTACDP